MTTYPSFACTFCGEIDTSYLIDRNMKKVITKECKRCGESRKPNKIEREKERKEGSDFYSNYLRVEKEVNAEAKKIRDLNIFSSCSPSSKSC